MADESHYASATDSGGNKRKYDETKPSTRRVTGFSSPDSVPAPYSSVLLPTDEIEIAKQRAQEIAARLVNNASAGAVGLGALDAKRSRFENGGGFDANDVKSGMPNSVPYSIPVSYGYQGTSKKIEIPNGRVGVIIGKGGETIKYLQLQSGAKIQVTRDMDADPNSPNRMVELMGTSEQIAKAEQLITEVLAGAEAGAGAGGQGMVSRRVGGQAGSEQYLAKIPNNKVGLIIGKGGETIKNMQARSGARIQVIPLHLPPGDPSTERTLQIDGTTEQIENAKQLVNEVISENRPRNPAMAGGYTQPGYQARPPSSWTSPGAPPMQQPGYGYGQPGAYPGPSSQYNMSQTPYSGYLQPSNWDNSTVPPTQQTQQGGGYDYYGQQPTPSQQQTPSGSAAPADNTGYNYNQPAASGYQQGQEYSQDGYSGYQAPQSGYVQPTSYDQQQGYSAPSYGNVTNPTQDGHDSSYNSQGDSTQAPSIPPSLGQQGYGTAGQQPIPASYPPNQPGYGMPPTSQVGYVGQAPAQSYGPGYGTPQTQKLSTTPPVYGQTTQAPNTPGSYGLSTPTQPGYSHPQPPPSAYAQPDSSLQPGAPASYGGLASQPGYTPPYGAPPVSQPGYGQVPPYNTSYGASYSQPSASADGSTRVTYDAAPASQSVQASRMTKASPSS